MVPEKQGLKLDEVRDGTALRIGLSSGSRKTRIETGRATADAQTYTGLSSGSRKTRIETASQVFSGFNLICLSSGSRKTRIETRNTEDYQVW